MANGRIPIAGVRHLAGVPSDYTAPTNAILHGINGLVSEYQQGGGDLSAFSVSVGADGHGGTVVAIHGFKA